MAGVLGFQIAGIKEKDFGFHLHLDGVLRVHLLWVFGLELHIWLFGVYLMLFWILYCSCFMSSNSPPAIYVVNTLAEYLL
jgi:hypothetical protein